MCLRKQDIPEGIATAMVRLKDMEALEDLTGKLANGFRGVTLRELQDRLVAGQPTPPAQENAASIVTAFYDAAEKLQSREAAFNRNARPGATGLNLKANLRSPEHIADMRSFHQARQDLLALPGGFGQKIAAIVNDAITENAVLANPANTAKPQTGPQTTAPAAKTRAQTALK
jgi:hypothetical protein